MPQTISLTLANQPPRFISVEGTEGVGKSTVIAQLSQQLAALDIEVVCTREPGGSKFAEQLRELLLDPATQIHDDSELLLMFAARCDHIDQVILPALQAGKWVICDRFIDSTIAYQGFGRGQGDVHILAKIEQLIDNFVPCLPDVTLWLDLPVEEGLIRAGKRGKADRFEQQTLAFFAQVRAGFEYTATHNPQRVVRVDALGTMQTVVDRVWQVLATHLTTIS